MVSNFARNAERNNLYPFRVRRNPETGSAFTENGSVPYRNRECADYLPKIIQLLNSMTFH